MQNLFDNQTNTIVFDIHPNHHQRKYRVGREAKLPACIAPCGTAIVRLQHSDQRRDAMEYHIISPDPWGDR
jgi:hypothetical protein